MAKESSADIKSDEKKVVKKRNVIPTKLVIRRLPPYLTCEELLHAIDPLPDHDSFRYVSGDGTLFPDSFCRAYINLVSPDDLLTFRDRVDGLEFTDSKGYSQPCVLEYAPFQKNPKKNKKKEDSKAGTIEEDADYKAFLESLEAEEEKTVLDLEKYLEDLEKRDQKNKCIETPLTAFLKQKREEKKRLREERRRAEQERRRKEEKRKRDADRKKRLEAEKAKRKKEEDKKFASKKDDTKKDGGSHKEDVDDPRSDKSEIHSKGDGRHSGKSKYESKGPRLSDTKPKKPEQTRRGPIGAKPRDQYAEDEKHTDRPYSGKDSYERGGHSGRGGSRPRGGYRGSRDYPPRKWEKSDDTRNTKGSEDGEVKKSDKQRPKRPDREIYRPGGGRGGSRPSASSSRSHKYSEQRSGSRQDDEK